MADRREEQVQVRRQKLLRLRDAGVDPYPPRFPRTHTAADAVRVLQAAEVEGGPGARSEAVAVAGRVMAQRVMGRTAFLDLRDGAGRLQVQMRRDLLGEAYGLLKELDLGDILGVEGPVFRTRTGEATVEAHSVMLLSKALRPPPEKWHGLRDVEQRFRQREADLLSNEEVRERFLLRSRVVDAVRRFLAGRDFVEVETPMLVPVPAGAMAQPFVTSHSALDRTLYLRIAIELYLKRCIVGGLERVFEIGRVFRNEGLDADHNPEYTLLESYEAYADYNDVMRMVEEMVSTVAQEVLGTTAITWKGQTIELKPPWPRIDLRSALLEHSGVDIAELRDAPALARRMRELGVPVTQEVSWGRLVDKLLSDRVEPTLVQPAFLLDYPVEMSPLAKTKPDDPSCVERFEAFMGGMEIANAFTELNDPLEQRRRFQEQEELRRRHGDEDFDRLDEDFLTALEYGMPPTGGLGIGIDRLVMVLSGQPSIREVLLFPHLSWSQEELFRAVDQHVAAITADGLPPMETLMERVKAALPRELQVRITEDQLRSRVASFVQEQKG